MRLSLPALVLSLSAIVSADFYLAASETAEFSVGEPKAIQWNTSDFDGNVDLYIGPEDADEDDENAGTKIATDYPNSGSFNYTPSDDFETATYGKKKKKIWGHDKKKKGGKKGMKLIIIIIKHPYKSYYPKEPEKPKEPIVLPPVVLPPVVIPPKVELPPVVIPPKIELPPVVVPPKVELPPTVTLPPVIFPSPAPPVEKPTVVVPPVIIPTVIAPPIETPTITKLFPSTTIGTILPTGTGGGGGGGGGGTSPPIFTGAASIANAKPILAGGIMVLLVLGML